MKAENTDWKERAEQFLESHLTENDSYSEEAVVYFLSRDKKNILTEKAVENTINRWRDNIDEHK